MSTSALTSQGITLEYADDPDTPVTYTLVPEITDFSGPSGTTPAVTVSDLDSTTVEKRSGLPDRGQLSFTINYIPDQAAHLAVRGMFTSAARTGWRLSYTDVGATVDTFVGWVSGFAASGSVDTTLTAAVTIEIEGEITQT